MIGGNIRDFTDQLNYGQEIVFSYQGKKYFIQEQLDYLYYGMKPKWRGMFFGLKFAQLNALSEISGVSIREMFTGE